MGRQKPWVRIGPDSTEIVADTLFELVGPDRFDDLAGPAGRLAGFLRQYWGGPADYSVERGHPRLRMRHAPYVIGSVQRDAWLACMSTAVAGGGLTRSAESAVMEYFLNAAQHLVNTPD